MNEAGDLRRVVKVNQFPENIAFKHFAALRTHFAPYQQQRSVNTSCDDTVSATRLPRLATMLSERITDTIHKVMQAQKVRHQQIIASNH